MSKPVGIDYALLVGIGLTWGSQFVFNELAIESLSPLTVAAGRVFIGFITLSIVVILLPKDSVSIPASIARQPWGLYCGIALAEAILPCFLIPWGQQHVDSSIASILLATVPIFTLVLAPFIVKEESWSLIATLSAVVGFIGVVVLVAPNIEGNVFTDIIGELAILGGALSFSLSLIMMKRLPAVPPVLAMRNVFLIGSIPLLIMALILDAPWTHGADTVSLLALLALGVLCGGLAYLMFIYMVNRTGPTFASMSNYLVTLVGVFIGIVFLGDQLQRYDIVALVLIVVALVIGRFKKG
jgi:drug/metabolite transporter (DMT)-like permease